MKYLEELESKLNTRIDIKSFYHLKIANPEKVLCDDWKKFKALSGEGYSIYVQFNADGSIFKVFPFGGNHFHVGKSRTPQPSSGLYETDCSSRVVNEQIPVIFIDSLLGSFNRIS